MTRLRFRPIARDELRNAREHYEQENPVAASNFMREVVRGLRLVREAPLRWPRLDGKRRRFVLPKFEYSLVYRYDSGSDTLWVLAVAHHRRDPQSWSGR